MTNAYDSQQDQQQDPGLSFAWTPRNWWSLQRVAERAPQAERPAAPTSFGLPPGGPTGPYGQAPFRASPQQLYIPSAANRDGAQWGRPPQYPMQPQAWQIPGIFRGLGQQLSQWGSAGVAPAAARLFQSTGAYTVNFAKGQMLGMQMQHQKMVNDALALQNQLQKELVTYGEIYQLFDPTDPARQDQFKDALRQAAHRFGDDTLINALDTKDIAGAEKYLKWLDKNFADTHTSVAAQERERRADEIDAPLLGTGTSPDSIPAAGAPDIPAAPTTPSAPAAGEAGQPAGSDADPLVDPDPQPLPDNWEPPATTSPGQSSDAAPAAGTPERTTAAPSQQDQQRQPQVAEADSDLPDPGLAGLHMQASPQEMAQAQRPSGPTDYSRSQVIDNTLRSYPRANRDLINQMAIDALMGNTRGLPPRTSRSFGVVSARAAEIEGQFNQIIRDPNLRGDQVLHAVNQISPMLAEHIKGFADGSMAPTRGASLARSPWNYIYALTKKYDPTVDQTTFFTRLGTLRSFSSGQDGRNMTSIATAYSHLHSYLADLQKLKQLEGSDPGILQWAQEQWGTTKVIGKRIGVSPEQQALFARLNNEMDTAGTEYERALTGGKPTVTGREDQMRSMNWKNQDVNATISDTMNKIGLLNGRMHQQLIRFTGGVGRQPAALKKMFQTYSAEGRGGGTDELGALSVPDANTSRIADWMIDHPGQPLPDELAPAAGGAPAGGGGVQDYQHYFQQSPPAGSGGGGAQDYREYFR